MPALKKEMRDIEPAVTMLRSATQVIPYLVYAYTMLQFGVIGFFFGPVGFCTGILLGITVGYFLNLIVTSVFVWMIHVLFLLRHIQTGESSNVGLVSSENQTGRED